MLSHEELRARMLQNPEVMAQYEAGAVDFTLVTQIQQNLVLQQDTLAQAQGEIALGLIQVYRALGGGWQIRTEGCEPTNLQPAAMPQAPPQSAPPRPAGRSECGRRSISSAR